MKLVYAIFIKENRCPFDIPIANTRCHHLTARKTCFSCTCHSTYHLSDNYKKIEELVGTCFLSCIHYLENPYFILTGKSSNINTNPDIISEYEFIYKSLTKFLYQLENIKAKLL